MGPLRHKHVVITDSNDFMGPAIAARFKREGARVLSLIHI